MGKDVQDHVGAYLTLQMLAIQVTKIRIAHLKFSY